MQNSRQPPIADLDEIKRCWTSIIRNNDEKTADRLKACEYLAKISDESKNSQIKIIAELGELKNWAE